MKKLMVAAILGIMLICGVVPAMASFDKSDAVLLALRVIDWGQTRNIAQDPEHYHELNPILGEHPSVKAVNIYFVSIIAIDQIIDYVADKNPKLKLAGTAYKGLAISASAWCVNNNYNIKLKVKF